MYIANRLVRELLLLDIDYREMDGDRLSRKEYLALLPEDKSTVELIFKSPPLALPDREPILPFCDVAAAKEVPSRNRDATKSSVNWVKAALHCFSCLR